MEEDTGVEREATAVQTGTEIRLLIAWSAHKLALKDTLTLPNIYADVGPYLYGLSGYRNDVFSYQSRGVIDSNIILLARQDQTAAPRAVEKSLSQLPRAVPKPDEGEVFKVKERALERLLHRPRPDLSGVIYAREAFRTLVKAAFRRSQQETSYDDIARVVSPHYPMLVKGGFTYVTYYVLIMDTLRSLGAQSNGKNTWSLPSATTYPTEEDVELATRSTWRTESTLESPAGSLSNSTISPSVVSPPKRRHMGAAFMYRSAVYQISELRDQRKRKPSSDSESEEDQRASDTTPTGINKRNHHQSSEIVEPGKRPRASSYPEISSESLEDEQQLRGTQILRTLVWDLLAKNKDTGLHTADLLTRLAPIVKGLPNASNEPYTSTSISYAIGQVCRKLRATRSGQSRNAPWRLSEDVLSRAPSEEEVQLALAAAENLRKQLGIARAARVSEVTTEHAREATPTPLEEHDVAILIRSLCARESGASRADFDDLILPLFTGLQSGEGKTYTSISSYPSVLKEYLEKLGCRPSGDKYFLPARELPRQKDVVRVTEAAFKARRKEIDLEDDVATLLVDFFSKKSTVSSDDLRAFVTPYTEDLLSFGSIRRVAATLCQYRDGLWTLDAEKSPTALSALDVKAAVKAIQLERERRGLEKNAPQLNQVQTPAAAAPQKIPPPPRDFTEKPPQVAEPPQLPVVPQLLRRESISHPDAQRPPLQNQGMQASPPSLPPVAQPPNNVLPSAVSDASGSNQAPRILKIEYVTRHGDIGEYGKVRLAGMTEADILSMVTREKAPLYFVVDSENMVIYGSIEAYFDALPHLPLCVRIIPRPAADRF